VQVREKERKRRGGVGERHSEGERYKTRGGERGRAGGREGERGEKKINYTCICALTYLLIVFCY